MRRMVVVFIAGTAVWGAFACGTESAPEASSSSGGPSPNHPEAGDAPGPAGSACSSAVQQCDPPVDVSTSDDVVAKILATKEGTAPTYTLGRDLANVGSTGADLAPTVDLHATVDIDVDIEPIHAAAFTVSANGASCLAYADGGTACIRIHIAVGTVLRFYRAVVPSGMFQSESERHVDVLGPCSTPCTAEAPWCGAAKRCIKLQEFCPRCDGKSLAVCACALDCVASREGASCEYNTSQDTFQDGVCTAGECK